MCQYTSVQLQEELGKFVSQALLVYWYVERFEKQKNINSLSSTTLINKLELTTS